MNSYQIYKKILEREKQLTDLIIEKNKIIENLQSKIDKAIEYIKNFNEPIEFFDTEELLDILKEDK